MASDISITSGYSVVNDNFLSEGESGNTFTLVELDQGKNLTFDKYSCGSENERRTSQVHFFTENGSVYSILILGRVPIT